jgi:hypothetical protein
MIMEDLVTFEIAKKLKEKGFREECFARYYCSDKAYFERNSYHPNTESIFYCYNNDEDLSRFYIDAPTISQVLKWLREEKNIILTPNPSYFEGDCCLGWDCDVWASGNYDYCCVDYKTYEQAAIAGIEYVLDNLI